MLSKSVNAKGIKKTKKKRVSRKNSNPVFKDRTQVSKPEKKWIDVTGTLVPPIGSAWVAVPLQLNPTSSGSGSSNRIGSKIEMTSLLCRLNALWQGGQTTNAPQQIRYVIVYDKQSNQAAPSRGDVFADGTLWNSPLNLTNQDRFIIIADVLGDQIESNGQFCVATEIFRKMALDSVWPTSGTTQPATGSVTLWVAANSDWNDSTSAHFPSIQIYSRIRFTDC